MLSASTRQKLCAAIALHGSIWFGVIVLFFVPIRVQAAELIPVVASAPSVTAHAPIVVPEYNAKAGFLLAFTRYVEWPAGSFASPADPVVIGVLGANPFDEVLERTVQGVKSQGRAIEVRSVKTVEEAARCQVVFIARKQERDEAAWLQALRGKPVLTVIESERGLERGAILSLLLDESVRGTRVAFHANLPAAREAGLQISALMLASARKVIREPAGQKGPP